jgi:hypothetical protein
MRRSADRHWATANVLLLGHGVRWRRFRPPLRPVTPGRKAVLTYVTRQGLLPFETSSIAAQAHRHFRHRHAAQRDRQRGDPGANCAHVGDEHRVGAEEVGVGRRVVFSAPPTSSWPSIGSLMPAGGQPAQRSAGRGPSAARRRHRAAGRPRAPIRKWFGEPPGIGPNRGVFGSGPRGRKVAVCRQKAAYNAKSGSFCHAEGRGFESHQPLQRPCKSDCLASQGAAFAACRRSWVRVPSALRKPCK